MCLKHARAWVQYPEPRAQNIKYIITYDPGILLLVIYPKELKTGSETDIYASTFTTVLFIITKITRKQSKCP